MAILILPLINDPLSKIEQRYLSKVVKQDNCWSWNGFVDKKGYARLAHVGKRGQSVFAHRISYALHFGIEPGDFMVCHKCDNPICTNPNHLFLGTAQDNSNDMVSKGRSPCRPIFGELNPRSILTKEEARYIKLASMIRMSNKELGKLFNVHHSTVSMIKLGKSWADIEI
jgi:hypothetical protein